MTKVKYIKENDAPRLHGYILASTRRLCRYNHASTRRLCRYNLVTTLTRQHMHNHVTTTTMHVAKASDSKQMNKHKHVKALLRIKEKRPLIRQVRTNGRKYSEIKMLKDISSKPLVPRRKRKYSKLIRRHHFISISLCAFIHLSIEREKYHQKTL